MGAAARDQAATGQLVEWYCVCLWSRRSEVQISVQSIRTQYCERFTSAVTFLGKKLCFLGAMTLRLAPQTRYTIQRIRLKVMTLIIGCEDKSYLKNQDI